MKQNEGTISHSLPPVSAWIRKSFEIYFKKENLVYLTKFALLQLLLQIVIFFVLFGFAGALGGANDAEMSQRLQSLTIGSLPFLILGGILFVFFSGWVGMSTMKAVSQIIKGKILSVPDTFRITLKQLIPMVLLGFMVGLITLFGLILLIIPGIIFMVWFSMATYALISDNLGPIAAMERSRALARGYFWSILWRLFVAGVISMIISLMTSFLVFPVVQMVASVLISPLFYIPPFLLYFDLKKVHNL